MQPLWYQLEDACIVLLGRITLLWCYVDVLHCCITPQDALADAADIVSASLPTLSKEIPSLLDDWAEVERAAAATSTTTGRAKAAAAAAAAAASAAGQQQLRLVRPAVRPQVRH
jgi:hypothetical protein